MIANYVGTVKHSTADSSLGIIWTVPVLLLLKKRTKKE